MKQKNKGKFDLMSDCLKQFKQIPQHLQNFTKNNANDPILKLVACSNKFVQLADSSEPPNLIQSQIPLFHRFFSRLRQILYTSLTYYLHLNHSIFIREILIEINKRLMDYRPGGGYSFILMGISSIIMSNVMKIAHSTHFTEVKLRQIQSNSQQIKIIKRTTNNYISKTERLVKQVATQVKENKKDNNKDDSKDSNKDNNKQVKKEIINIRKNNPESKVKQKQKLSTQSSLPKFLYSQAIQDIDELNLQKITRIKSEGCEQIYRDCLTRNRGIRQIMNKFSQRYKAYGNKPEYRKNQNWPQYNPTSIKKQKSAVGRTNRNKSPITVHTNSINSSFNNFNNFNINFKKRNISTSFQKRKYSKQRQAIARLNSQEDNQLTSIDIKQIQRKCTTSKQARLEHQNYRNLFGSTAQEEEENEEIINYDVLKQQIFNQVYAYRQKYTMRKVTIGANDMHTNDASIHERFKPATSNSKPSSSSFGASMMNTRTFRLYGQSINYNANNQSNANPNSGTEGSLNTTSPNMMGSVKTNYSSVHNSSSINLDKQANLSGNTTVNPKANKNSTNKSINNIGTHRFKFVRCVANNQMGSNNSSKSYINGISGVSAEKTKQGVSNNM